MSCSAIDLNGYVLGELDRLGHSAVEGHVSACEGCREELQRLRLTHTALLELPQEEIPRRIAFVSDKVFEPRWWQAVWRSGPALGFASAAVLAAAILVHAFARPAPVFMPPAPSVAAARLERGADDQFNQRLQAAVAKAISETEARHAQQTARLLEASEKRHEFQRQADLLAVQDAMRYYEKMAGRMVVASNNLSNNLQGSGQ